MTKMQPEGTDKTTYAKIDISSQRSLKSCIATGWKFFADSPKYYVNSLWLASLIGGFCVAVASYGLSELWAGLAVPYSLYIKSGIPEKEAMAMITPSANAWIAAAITLLALIIGTCVFKGKLWTFVRNATISNQAEAPHRHRPAFAISRGELKTGLTATAVDVVFGIVSILIFSATLIAAIHTSAWLLLILMPLFICLYIIYMAYSIEKLAYSAKPLIALKSSFGISCRRFGGMLFVTAIPAITTGMIAIAVCMPVVTMCLAIQANAASELTGEAAGLPPFFPALFLATSTIAFTAASLMASLNLWPALLKVASEKVKAASAVTIEEQNGRQDKNDGTNGTVAKTIAKTTTIK